MSDQQDLLVVEEVVAGYTDIDILHGVSLSVRQDEIVTIIGPNGAGKSTLAKTIFGLLQPRSGDIRFQGKSLVGITPAQIVNLGLCYVPQVRNVFPNLSVRENLEIGGFLLKQGRREAIERVLDFFPDLREKANDKAGTLSGGQRQMVAIGRALMLEPALILLDEPSAGLAPQLVDMVFDKVREINETGRAILMVEQNARRALAISDRGYVLDMGENALDGPGEDLLIDPEVIDLYLGRLGQAQAE